MIEATPAEVAELYSRLVTEELELNLDDCGDRDCACDCEDDKDDNPDVQVIKMELNQLKDKLLAELIKKIADGNK